MAPRRRTNRVSKEFDAMKKEIADLRAAHLERVAKSRTADDDAEHLTAIKEEIGEALALIKKKIEMAGSEVGDDVAAEFQELREVVADYFSAAEKTVAAHPLAALAGAVAVGFALGRLTR